MAGRPGGEILGRGSEIVRIGGGGGVVVCFFFVFFSVFFGISLVERVCICVIVSYVSPLP